MNISLSHICEAEAKVGGSERQLPVAPTKVKRGKGILPSNGKRGSEIMFYF